MSKWPEKYIIGLYFLFFGIGFTVFSLLVYGENIVTRNNLLHWDADLYYFVSVGGYYKAYVAFFPLFPYVWRWTGLDVFGICLLNALVYGVGLHLLTRTFNFSKKQLLLFLSFPAVFFLFLPYAESFFFLACAFLLYALEKKKMGWFYLVLFVSGFCRPTASVFLPALCILFAYKYLVKERRIGSFLLHTGSSVLLCLLAFYLVMILQYRQTGEWLSFFYYQDVDWGNRLGLPSLPFRSWGTDKPVWLADGAALLLTICSAVLLIYYTFRYFSRGKLPQIKDAEFFSLLYIAGVGLIVVFFRGGWLFSINRFIFCTAFFSVGTAFLLNSCKNFTSRQMVFLGLGVLLFSSLLGCHQHLQLTLLFLAFTLYVLLWFYSQKNTRSSNLLFIVLFCIQVYFQFFLFGLFLKGFWVA